MLYNDNGPNNLKLGSVKAYSLIPEMQKIESSYFIPNSLE